MLQIINTTISFNCRRLLLICCILSFASNSFPVQPEPLFVFLPSEAGSNNKRDKTKSSKHQSHEGIFFSETDKYIVSFFFLFFFQSEFSFATIHESQDCRGRERAFLSLLTTIPPASQTFRY